METLGTLAGGIAHDFNNILAAILAYTELSIEEAQAGSTLHENLQQVLDATLRARQLAHQILVFSRQATPERTPVTLAPVVDEALRLVRASLSSDIKIERSLRTDTCVMA